MIKMTSPTYRHNTSRLYCWSSLEARVFLIVIILGQSAQHKYIVLDTFINSKVHVCQF